MKNSRITKLTRSTGARRIRDKIEKLRIRGTTLVYGSLDHKKAKLAVKSYDLLKEFWALRNELELIEASASNLDRPIFVINVNLLRELITELTPNENEAISYLSGTQIGTIRVLHRTHPVELDHASPVRAVENLEQSSHMLIRLIEQGTPVLCQAHRHPGSGIGSTKPSPTDHRFFSRIEKAGSELLGIIVTADSAVRFFTHRMPFEVILDGDDTLELKQEGNSYVVQLP